MGDLALEVNNRLDVLYEEKIYKCQVQDLEENFFNVNIPVSEGEYLTVPRGIDLEFMSFCDDGDVYKFKSTIISRSQENNISMYVMANPFEIQKIQRRDYVRVKVAQIINYITGDYSLEDIDELRLNNAILLDLSGGGMRVKVKEQITKGDKIISQLKYGTQELFVKGTVVRVEATEDKKWIYGVVFDEIDERTRDRIIRMVFDIMRKQRELL
ncbi:flagellar brake protein [Clostridium manihotivorum]|jgi:c-di-GMP-binding flagellar brake protein YcgR|uniref:Pilus assembly protein PilZ n=1 Tax=Clostridium manihotivorum TaxID=2320868 RepID=A0A410DR44_9CLOT|nr:PilZ domain-containing protein [Clostridium manihotivorum]QAA31693.1 pilus assembly protein PilZ [Clostridium manihotivorum]